MFTKLINKVPKFSMRYSNTPKSEKSTNTPNKLKFKQHFKSLNYYSMPTSILYTFRKRVHFLGYFGFALGALLFTIL